MRPADIKPDRSWPDVNVFEECLEIGKVSGFIVGGATQRMLKDPFIAKVNQDQDGALYQSISPICIGFDCEKMLNAMFIGQS